VVVLISDIVIEELRDAPEQVQDLLASLPPSGVSRVELTRDVIELRDAYVAAGVLSKRFVDDATHVAAATVARADAIASWNFRHIVRLDKMRLYNQVNLQNGFGLLSIVSPREVRFDDDKQG
jgi:hypothetical protein